MSADAFATMLWFVAGTAFAAAFMRQVPAFRLADPIRVPGAAWPLAMRPFLAPARLVSVLIDPRLPAPYRGRVRRRLERADLYPGMDAPQWTGLCLSASATTCLITFLLCEFAGLGWRLFPLAALLFTWLACERWIDKRAAECERRIVRDLPPCLDLLAVCVEAGATLTAAARFIVEQAPDGPLKNYFDRVLREVRSGRARSQAFTSVAQSYGVESLTTLASALSHAEASGMSVGQVLRTQAEQRSAERFVRAERQAMQAPVKMLGPLILCIFPCTFIVLAVPIAHRLMEAFRT